MISLEEARRLIDEHVSRLPAVTIPLLSALSHALDEDVVAPIDVPQFASSNMDGIALRISDLKGDGPWRLPLQMTIAAGQMEYQPLLPGHVVKIMTGAPLIKGADTVVPIEDVTLDDEIAIISHRPAGETFVRLSGDDISVRQKLYDKGAVLKPMDIGVLASMSITRVRVIPSPRIAFFSTGPELVEPGQTIGPGQIYDSNSSLLHSLLFRDGHLSVDCKGSIDDKPAAVETALHECLQDHDLVITTGAVSAGDFDFIPDVVRRQGGNIIFHKVFIKPGKPTLLARRDHKWILGLPGNPVGVVVGYHLFARRVIARLMGTPYSPRKATAVLGSDLSIEGDRFCLVGARLDGTADGIIAHPSVRQKSNRLSSIIGIDGFIFVEGGARTVPEGARVNVEWL